MTYFGNARLVNPLHLHWPPFSVTPSEVHYVHVRYERDSRCRIRFGIWFQGWSGSRARQGGSGFGLSFPALKLLTAAAPIPSPDGSWIQRAGSAGYRDAPTFYEEGARLYHVN